MEYVSAKCFSRKMKTKGRALEDTCVVWRSNIGESLDAKERAHMLVVCVVQIKLMMIMMMVPIEGILCPKKYRAQGRCSGPILQCNAAFVAHWCTL